MQWTDPIYPILLNNNHKIVHSLFGLTPNDASMPSTACDAYINVEFYLKLIEHIQL